MTADSRRVLGRWIRRAEAMGWTVAMTGGGHYRWRSPSGTTVITPSTPSGVRWMRNARAQLRRAGLDVQ